MWSNALFSNINSTTCSIGPLNEPDAWQRGLTVEMARKVKREDLIMGVIYLLPVCQKLSTMFCVFRTWLFPGDTSIGDAKERWGKDTAVNEIRFVFFSKSRTSRNGMPVEGCANKALAKV